MAHGGLFRPDWTQFFSISHNGIPIMDTPGTVIWIGIRPGRKMPLISLLEADAIAGSGLAGDHYHSPDGKRQITLIREKDLEGAGKALSRGPVDPGLTRRNLVVRGLPGILPEGSRLHLGTCLLQITGPCHPCHRMEENLGEGGLKALAGKGGMTARIISGGPIKVGDPVRWGDPSS